MTGVLESLAYAIARGVTRAWFDVCAERKTAEVEKITDEDHARADRFADAIRGVSGSSGDTGQRDTPSGRRGI